MNRLFVLALFLLVPAAIVPAQEKAQVPDTSAFTAPPGRGEEYVIGANDLLEIKFFELAELGRDVRVSTDGTISLPLLGQVPVAGLTPRQAEESIAKLLQERELLKNPQVTVLVKEFVSRRVSVQGAVSKPGMIDLLGQRTLLDVIGEAGGLVERAMMKIYVIRPFGKPGEERIEIDAEKLVYQGDPMANLLVQPGDIIMIPYEQPFKLFVNGAVQRPGPVDFKSG